MLPKNLLCLTITTYPHPCIGSPETDLMRLKMLEKPYENLQISVPSNGERIYAYDKSEGCRNYRKIGLRWRSEEHTSELQSHSDLVCRLLLDGDRTDRQAFIELILQRQQKLRNEPRNENNILNRKENVDGDRNQTYNYITPDAVYTA